MRETIWLASYPKSGNTWLRLLITALSTDRLDINDMERSALASGRAQFDNHLLIDSGLLTHDEIDLIRPRLYEEIAAELAAGDDDPDEEVESYGVRFAKVHDAYTQTSAGEPLLAGRRAARGAVVIVRDPRDVAPSLANHLRSSLDRAISFMNNPEAVLAAPAASMATQLRQKLPTWSGHVASWLDQSDIPVHLVRYEELKANTASVLAAALRFAGAPADPSNIVRAVALAAFENLQAQERETGFGEWVDRSGAGRVFFRRGESGNWREELSREQVRRIEEAHGAMMLRLGYVLSSSE